MTKAMPGTLFLIPVNLSEPFLAEAILPQAVIATALRLDFYVAENAKTARAFLKAVGIQRPLQEVSIQELNERTRKEELAGMLKPLLAGCDVGLVSEAGAPGIADPGADQIRLGDHVQAVDGGRALARFDQRSEHAHGRGLAGPVGTQQPVYLTGSDTEREVLDSTHLAKALPEPFDFHYGIRHRWLLSTSTVATALISHWCRQRFQPTCSCVPCVRRLWRLSRVENRFGDVIISAW